MRNVYFGLLGVAVLVGVPAESPAQDRAAVEQAATAITNDWIRAWNAHDADAYAALFDPAASMLILGTYYPSVDSLKAGAGQVMAARSNEHWTLDRIAVRVFNDHQALVQALFSGRYTTASGATWEFKSSGYLTMLVELRDGTWKIVAAQNHGSGTRVNP